MMKSYPPGLVRLFTDEWALDNGLNAAYVKRLLEGKWPADKDSVDLWRETFNSYLLADGLRDIAGIARP